MAVLVIVNWPNVSVEQYDRVRESVGWERETPDGGLLHMAAHDGTGMRIFDLWESPEKFQAFVETRLMPGVQQAGVAGAPSTEVYPVHAVFSPVDLANLTKA